LFALCLFLTCQSVSSVLPSLLSPTFIWSGQPILNDKMQVEESTVFPAALFNFVQSLAASRLDERDIGALGKHWSPANFKPEVVIVWMEPMGKLAHESYAFLQPTLNSSVSSVIVRNYWPSADFIRTWLTIPSSILVGRGNKERDPYLNIRRVTKNDFPQFLRSNQGMFSDGKTDVIVVFLTQKDAVFYMRNIQSTIEELSGGNYVAIYTSDKAYEPEIRTPSSRSYVRGSNEVQRLVTRSTSDDYWPRSVYEGLLIVITFGIILAVGICCLVELQTPTKWEKTKRNIREVN